MYYNDEELRLEVSVKLEFRQRNWLRKGYFFEFETNWHLQQEAQMCDHF